MVYFYVAFTYLSAPQREYLERCEDRKSYNYLVGGLVLFHRVKFK